MTFKKLALASAVALVPAMGFAMEEVDDALLSGVTGQDGISIQLNLNVTTNVLLEDDDGVLAPSTYNTPGAIKITGMSMVSPDIDINIDAGGDAGTNAMLAIEVDLSGGLTIQTGAITVANTDGNFLEQGTESTIFTSQTITLPNTTSLRIELGSEETNFLTLTGDIGTITLGAGSLADADGSTISWGLGTEITGLTTTGLTVDVEAAGLVIDLPAGMNNVGMEIIDLTFGTAPAIGDVKISGLNLSGTSVTIAGH